jgi:DNA-binding MarR family transcriptional regulator
MSMTRRTPAGEAVTELILEVFRLNGRLLVAGDRLVSRLGLSSARWQVLGAVALAERAEPVAWIARSMGLNRQGVQRIVNELVAEGYVALEPNPHHRRASLVVLTEKGRTVYAAADRLQTPWVNALVKGLGARDIAAAKQTVAALRQRLEQIAPGTETAVKSRAKR